MPVISVIVPVYRVEKYIHRCVDSILAQTFSDFELILVDDGSPDNCGAICDKYAQKDSRVIVLHQENGGLSAARNVGIDWAFANSNSQWLTFVDSDDWIVSDYLQCLYAHSDIADIVTCKHKCYDEYNELYDGNNDSDKINSFSGKESCLHLYGMDETISIEAYGKLYKKELFEQLRFPYGKIHEDQAIVPLLLYKANRVVAMKSELYCYFMREESITHQNFSAKRFDDIDALNSCISFFYNNNEGEIAKLAEKRRALLWGLYTLYAHKAKIMCKIPRQYRLTIISAIGKMEKKATFDQVTWYMAKVYPQMVTPYAYWCKVRRMLGIPYDKEDG